MRPVRDWWRRSDWGLHLAVAAISLLLAILALELWDADLFVPFSYSGDAIPVASHFKTVFENGWYEFNPLLGEPSGQVYHDFPTSDNTNFLLASLLSHLLGDPILAMNVYYLVGFPLAGAAASWFIRVAGASKAMTLAAAPLFAILSYHFLRGEPHMFLAAYFVVPLSLVLVLRAARGERLWGWRDSPSRVARFFGRGTQTVVIAGLTGMTQAYYAVFALILLAGAGILALVRDRAWRRFWGAVVAGGIVVVVLGLNMIDDTIYGLVNGANPGGFQRGHADAEIYALKLAQLVLPWPGHRIPQLQALRGLYDTHYPLPSEQPSLGIVAAAGFLILLGIVVHRAIAGFRGATASERTRTLGVLGALVLIAFLFATVGGFSTLISFLTASIRGWNRMSVLIALLCLAAVALLLDAWLERIAERARRRGRASPSRARSAWAAAFAVVLLVVGYVDQTPAGLGAGYAETIARWNADDAYFRGIQAQLRPGDWVVQLPYESFPEDTGPTGVLGSEVLIPYLHTTGIGWTGGGIKGRPAAEWTQALEDYPAAEIPAIAAAAGASGILVDRHAVPTALQDLEPGLDDVLGAPQESADGRYAFWPLAAVAARLAADPPAGLDALAAAIVSPVLLQPGDAFALGWDEAGRAIATLGGGADPAGFDLVNDRGEPAEIELELDFTAGGAGLPDGVTVTLADGATLAAATTGSGASGTWTVTVPPGTTHATIAAPGGTRGLGMRWRVLDPAIRAAFAD